VDREGSRISVSHSAGIGLVNWGGKRNGEAVVIKKVKSKYVVLSEKTGRSFGSYKTLAGAKKRLGQVEFFKHRGKKK
jgi:hypothetical protein